MYKQLFEDFIKSSDTLRVYRDRELLFSSVKDGLLPLLEYNSKCTRQAVTVFDKIMGNAAALLAIRAGCIEVQSPMGSELAIKTLDKYRIKHDLSETVPFIKRLDGKVMCPMEMLSLGKEPEEFFLALTRVLGKTPEK